ncbi:cobalamin-binding protein [Paludibacterium paludis]|uniref:Cobalamin-binding protein n=1 Tax=Paludibacterium paludis TaxID=1225769 RepID=A0A918U807_9NEIS|nr:cobalamin-binding protein [Paludibacterium paludis]GGY05335.1 cobalamin-binding protein [Paludibacterium paludis]
MMFRPLCLALMLLAAPRSFADVSVRDDRGKTVSLKAPARRIISLAPHLTEDVFAIGAGRYLVGAVDYSDYPAEARRIPRVGGYNGFDLERIRALRPDLIVAWQSGNPPHQLERIEALGIPVFYDASRTLADIPTVLDRLGTLTGDTRGASRAAGQFRERLATLARTHAGQRPVRVFYQVWDRPLMTVNREQIISDAMRQCAAVNVFGALPSLVPTIDDEAVLKANPELIVTSHGPGAQSVWLGHWKRFPGITAVARGQLAHLPPDLLSRLGPRMIDGAEALCAAVDKARAAR